MIAVAVLAPRSQVTNASHGVCAAKASLGPPARDTITDVWSNNSYNNCSGELPSLCDK
jgi:hypothetical protein